MRPRKVKLIHRTMSVAAIALIALTALVLSKPGGSQAAPVNGPQVIQIFEPNCQVGTVWSAAGIAVVPGVYRLYAGDTQDSLRLVDSQVAKPGDIVDLRPTETLHPGQRISAVLKWSMPASGSTGDHSAVLDSSTFVGPTGADCATSSSR